MFSVDAADVNSISRLHEAHIKTDSWREKLIRQDKVLIKGKEKDGWMDGSLTRRDGEIILKTNTTPAFLQFRHIFPIQCNHS